MTGLYQVAIAPLCSAGWTVRTKARKSATPPVTGVTTARSQRSGIGTARGPGRRDASHENNAARAAASRNVPTEVTFCAPLERPSDHRTARANLQGRTLDNQRDGNWAE